MARTVDELLSQLRKFVPEYFDTAEPLLGATPAALVICEQEGDLKVAQVTIEGAAGSVLTLLARGYGLRRTTDELDARLRARLRAIEDRITRPAIIAAVEALDPVLVGNVTMIEWFDEPYLDVDAYLDTAVISGGPRSFVLVVPLIGEYHASGGYVETDAYLDVDAYLGSGGEDPIYSAIVAAVEERRGGGIRWRLRVDPPS